MLLDKRLTFKPFEYEKAYDFWVLQQMSHWNHLEISMNADMADWKDKLSETEREVVGRTLKGFVQSEVVIQDYWSTKVSRWFKKPEIQGMAVTFSAMESIHQFSYAYLQETLGLEDFDAFLHEPSAKAKIDRLLVTKGKTKEEIARSLAIFSGFTEGVNLFSSFAILLSFSRFNKLKGVGQIIRYSIRDENLHSFAGCWLFREFIKEYPEVWTEDLKEEIYEAARETVKLEDDFINQSFALGDIESICSKDLKAYIRYRTNSKLKELGLSTLYRNIDKQRLQNLEWFSVLASGNEFQDFFAGNSTAYKKGSLDWSDAWEGIDNE